MAAAAAASAAGGSGGKKRVVALDFDGVVCDSVGESSLSAFRAAAIQWPEVFATEAAEAAKPRLVEQMRAVRPVVETGYENIVQIRCLYEGGDGDATVDEMLRTWHGPDGMLASSMARWGLDREPLVELFGRVRDEWIAADLRGWLAPNRIYPGVAEGVKAAIARGDEVYVVTTKQARFTAALLKDMAGIDLPADRIHSTTVSGEPKSRVLARLAEAHPGLDDYLFVEDKLSTLDKALVAPETAQGPWRLFLVDWGYNTPEERRAADDNPRIELVGVERFGALMGGAR